MFLICKALLFSSAIALEKQKSIVDVTMKEDMADLEKDVAFELKTEHILGGCCFLGLVCLFIICYAVALKKEIVDEDDHFQSCVVVNTLERKE